MKSNLKAIFAVVLIAQLLAVINISAMTADELSQITACKDCK